MCAMMPMFLQRSNGTVRATFFSALLSGALKLASRRWLLAGSQNPAAAALRAALPPIMRERLVGFRHTVHVFLLLDGCAAVVRRVEQFIRQLVGHALLAAATRIRDQPADRQRRAPVGIHFNWNLVVRATHTAGLYFEQGLAILDRLLEQLQALIAALLLQLREGLIEDALGS